jgi:hypothetical protein
VVFFRFLGGWIASRRVAIGYYYFPSYTVYFLDIYNNLPIILRLYLCHVEGSYNCIDMSGWMMIRLCICMWSWSVILLSIYMSVWKIIWLYLSAGWRLKGHTILYLYVGLKDYTTVYVRLNDHRTVSVCQVEGSYESVSNVRLKDYTTLCIHVRLKECH